MKKIFSRIMDIVSTRLDNKKRARLFVFRLNTQRKLEKLEISTNKFFEEMKYRLVVLVNKMQPKLARLYAVYSFRLRFFIKPITSKIKVPKLVPDFLRFLTPNKRFAGAVMSMVVLAGLILGLLPALRASALATTFQANYDNGSFNADYSFGSGTAASDGAMPTLVSGGYDSSAGAIRNANGSTLKYPTLSNLNSQKGEIEMKYQLPWDLIGDKTKLLTTPMGVWYDNASQYFYITDTGRHVIVRTKADGTGWVTLGTQGSSGSGVGQFNYPRGIYYDAASDYLYIADSSNSRIVKTKITGEGWTSYGSYGSGTGKFYYPSGITYDASTGYIYTTDFNNSNANTKIIKTKIDGTGWTGYGSSGSSTNQFGSDYTFGGIYYDAASQYLYISDTSNSRIVKTQFGGTGWTTYGSSGSGTGQFSSPRGLWYDPSTEYIYIADYSNHRMVKTKIDGTGWTKQGFSYPEGMFYDATGGNVVCSSDSYHFVVKTKIDSSIIYGTTGSGTGQFNNPTEIDFDPATDYYYIADSTNKRIVKTKIDGTGWTTYGTNGTGVGQFSSLGSISYDPVNDYIYVADTTNKRIVKTKIDGTGWSTVPCYGIRNIRYAGEDGYVYATTSSPSRIFKIKVDGEKYGSYGSGTGQFNDPMSTFYDSASGYYYVADYSNHRIVKTKIDGTGWTAFGTNGSGTNQFSNPWGIYYDAASEYIYVADSGNGRIVKTKIDGTGWTVFSTSLSYPRSIYYDAASEFIYVGRRYGITKTKIDGTGRVDYGSSGSGVGQFSYYSHGIYYDAASEYIYLADSGNSRITKTKIDGTGWTTYGSSGSGTGQFNEMRQLFYDAASDYIYVADNGNHRIVKTKMDGTGWTTANMPYASGAFLSGGYVHFTSMSSNTDYIGKIVMDGAQTYGTSGSGTGQFSNPAGIDYDPSTGYLYVSDYSNTRIVKTKMDGTGWQVMDTLGSINIDLGQTYSINRAVIQADGNDYYQVDYSADGVTWASFYNFSSTSSGLRSRDSSTTTTRSARYVRVRATYSDHMASISELKIYNTSGTNVAASRTPTTVNFTPKFGTLSKITDELTATEGTRWNDPTYPVQMRPNLYDNYYLRYDSGSDTVYASDRNRFLKAKMDGSSYSDYSVGSSQQGSYYSSGTGYTYSVMNGNQIIKYKVGDHDRHWGTNNLYGAYGVSYDSAGGDLYVVDYNDSWLLRTKWDGSNFGTFGAYGTGMYQFYQPRGLYLNQADGYLYVTYANGVIIKTKFDGTGWATRNSPNLEYRKSLFSTNGTAPLKMQILPAESRIQVDIGAGTGANAVSFGRTAVVSGTENSWHTLKVAYDNENGSHLYVDGVEAATTAATWTSLNWGDNFYIGNNAASTSEAFTGAIDEVKISSIGSDVASPTTPNLTSAKDSVTGTADLTTNTWYNHAEPYFTWNSTDAGSGIRDYFVYFGTNSTADPATLGTRRETAAYSASSLVSGSTYYLRVVARDNVANLTDPVTLFTYKYDGTKPESPTIISVDPPGNSRSTIFNFSWPAEEQDGGAVDTGGSGLAGYQLRIKDKNGTYSSWSATTTDTHYTFVLPDPDTDYIGTNIFQVRAIDNAGSVDETPVQNNFYYSAAATGPRNLSVTPDEISSENNFSFDWDPPTSYPGMGYYYSINILPTVSNKLTSAEDSLPAGPYASQQEKNTLYVLAADGENTNFDACSSISGNPEIDACAKVDFFARTPAPGYPTNVTAYDISNRDTSEYSVALKWTAPTDRGTGFDGYNLYRSLLPDSGFAKIGASSGSSYIDDNLTKEQICYYYMKSKDNTGQESIASQVISVTPTGRYTNPPLLKDEEVNVAAKAYSASVTWETYRTDSAEKDAGFASSFVLYGTERSKVGKENGGFTVGDPNKEEKHSVNLTGLDPSTVYYFKAMWEDVDGNQGASDVMTFATKEKPQIANVAADNITLTSANINWNSTNMTSARIQYCAGANCSDTTLLSTPDQSSHTVNLSSLTHTTKYTYRIFMTDIDGNTTQSDSYTFDTLTMPKIDGDVKMDQDKEAATTTYRFQWKTNVETTTVLNYRRDGSSTQSESRADYTKEHEVTVGSLADQSKYIFEITGVDSYGNKIENVYNNNVDTPLDSRPPKISNLSIEIRSNGFSEAQKAQIVASWDSDEPSSSQIEYSPGIQGKDYNMKSKEDAALTMNHVVIASELEPSKVYHLRVVSRDGAGNVGYSSDTTAITGKVQSSIIDVIMNSLEKSLGWLGVLFK